MSKRVLCLLAPGFEEIETVTPIDLLRRAGAEVVLASVDGQELVMGRSQMALRAEVSLADVIGDDFDLLCCREGRGLRNYARTGDRRSWRLNIFMRENSWQLFAQPRRCCMTRDCWREKFTAHFSVHKELPEAQADARVLEDGSIITSRGAGTAVDFGLTLVRRLFGVEKANEVARAIMA